MAAACAGGTGEPKAPILNSSDRPFEVRNLGYSWIFPECCEGHRHSVFLRWRVLLGFLMIVFLGRSSPACRDDTATWLLASNKFDNSRGNWTCTCWASLAIASSIRMPRTRASRCKRLSSAVA